VTTTALPDLEQVVDAGDVLWFYDPVDDTAVDDTYLAYGPVPVPGSGDRALRVFNGSDDYSALQIVVAVTGPPADSEAGDGSGFHLVSADGLTFAPSCVLGDLPPHAISAPLWLRRVVAPGTAPGDYAWLLTATAGSWTPAALDAVAALDADTGSGDTNPDADLSEAIL
jgi:hypothetical protein